jgi:tetratricopeptide (TPR) repeat protein
MKKFVIFIIFILASGSTLCDSWRALSDSAREYFFADKKELAIEYANRALDDAKSRYDLCHRNTLFVYKMLATMHYQIGNKEEVQKIFNAVEPCIEAEPEGYAWELKDVYSHLKEVCVYAGMLEEAKIMDGLLKKYESVFNSQYAEWYNKSLRVKELYNKGETIQALIIAKEVMKYSESEFGEKSAYFATSLNYLGLLYQAQGRNGEAEELYEEALLEMYRKLYPAIEYPKGHTDLAMSINYLGGLYYSQGRYGEAEELYEEALEMRRKLYPKSEYPNGHTDLAQSINNLGALYQAQGRYGEAEDLFTEALKMHQELYPKSEYPRGHPVLALSLNNLGLLYYSQGRYGEAEDLYTEALKMYQELYPKSEYPRGHTDLALSQNNLGALYQAQGRYGEAEDLYTEALQMYQELYPKSEYPRGHTDLAMSLNNLGGLYKAQGRYGEAEDLSTEALKMRRELYPKSEYPRGHTDLALSLNNLGYLYDSQGRYGEAEDLYTEALKMYQELYLKSEYPRGHTDLAQSINNLGGLYYFQGRYSEAEDLYTEALKMRRELYPKSEYPRGHTDLAQSINNLGGLYYFQGRYSEAEDLFTEALKMRRELCPKSEYPRGHPVLALSLNNLGYLYDSQGRYGEAEDLYTEALKMYQELYPKSEYPRGHTDLARSLNNLGLLYYSQGRYGEAEDLFTEALKMHQELCPKSEYPRGHPVLALSLNNLGYLYDSQGRYGEAEELFTEALDIYKSHYENNSKSMSEREREQFLETLLYNFEIFNSFAVKRYEENPKILVNMLNNRLYFKSILLNTSVKIRESIMSSGDESLISLYDDFLDTRRYINFLYTKTSDEIKNMGVNVDSVYKAANDIEKELARRSPAFKEQSEIYTFEDVRNKLKQDEAYIEIIRFKYYDKNWIDTVYYAALIVTPDTKDYPEFVLMENGNFIEENTTEDYLSQIVKGRFANASDFYNKLWKPIADKLDGASKLYVSLDGVYNKINLNTIYDPENSKNLIDEYDICYLTSVKDFIKDGKEYTNNNALIVGDPKFDLDESQHVQYASKFRSTSTRGSGRAKLEDLSKIKLDELAWTEKEVNLIDSILVNNGWQAEKYTEELALEEVVKQADNPRILHLSTHGKFLSDTVITENKSRGFISDKVFGFDISTTKKDPLLRSMLFFTGSQNTIDEGKSPDGTEDGILTAKEVSTLKLDETELVVLSACETGLGDVRNGEGVYGLQRAFRMAGAENIIMSLWEIPDQATQEFLTLFYTKWLESGEARVSFIAAQKIMKEKYPLPQMWGGLVFIGR